MIIIMFVVVSYIGLILLANHYEKKYENIVQEKEELISLLSASMDVQEKSSKLVMAQTKLLNEVGALNKKLIDMPYLYEGSDYCRASHGDKYYGAFPKDIKFTDMGRKK